MARWRAASTGDAENGELVRFEIARRPAWAADRQASPTGSAIPQDQRATSLIAIHAHGIPDAFPKRCCARPRRPSEPDIKRREDLRHVPLVTIDPADARDHDDAVWAEPDPDPKNQGGWVVMVAIADVAAYVRPGSALDKEAKTRGNSVYFPDRVVPMLPERISNDLCSLVAEEARPCLAVRMVFDKHGRKLGHRFFRGLMRSAASLTYEQAQAAIDGRAGRDDRAPARAGAPAALGRLRRPLPCPQRARAARSRSAGAQDPARRATGACAASPPLPGSMPIV